MKTTEIFWASINTLLVEQHAREIKKDKRLCLVKIFLLKMIISIWRCESQLLCCEAQRAARFWNAKQ